MGIIHRNKAKTSPVDRQLRRLYGYNALGNSSLAGAAWVLLLVSQGYSLVQVGLAETVFHLVSITAEVPSGVFADVAGRKKALMVSCLMSILSALTRGLLDGFFWVCVSIGFSALSYNFASGSDAALAYDSLLEAGCPDRYEGYVSRQTVIYRVFGGLATLGAGLAVMMGNRTAQLLSAAVHLIQLALAASLQENAVVKDNKGALKARVAETARESLAFLKGNRTVAMLILRNTLVGAVDVLLLFFLQAKLPMTGIPDGLLGPLLFIMSMGGVLGAKAAEKAGGVRFGALFALCMGLVLAGLLAEFTGVWWIMTLGGFAAAFADDLIQIRADIAVNERVPAPQRATLLSVNSLCFSLVMIVLSPLAGQLFTVV